MAATPFDPCRPVSNVFDIFNDATAAGRHAFGLPCGGCNFVDLTPGANGAKCGCRRFWARQVPGSPVPDQAGWCMCSHHACYHDHLFRGEQLHDGKTAGQENETPKTGREPLSPVLGTPLKTPPAVPAMDYPGFSSFFHNAPDDDDRRSRVSLSQHLPGSMPDTLAWGGFAQSPALANTNTLPPIPPQCLMSSQTTSIASSVRARYLRPFAGKGLQTLSGADNGAKPPSIFQPSGDLHPVTQQGITRPDHSFVFAGPDGQAESTTRPGTATQTEPRTTALPGAMAPEPLRGLTYTVSDHGHRLDRLETVSFHDECHDRLENFDVRMSELETRVDEVEKLANDNASVANARGARDEDAAAQSIVSAATSASTHSQDVMSHIHSLRAQVSQLQSYLPSPSHAWQLEVVFLPFPLKRLWQDIHQFKLDAPAVGSNDWTQLPMTHSTATRRSQSPMYSDWATADHVADWLLPRACGNTSMVDKRLRSRGLIQTASVKGPDYRSVQIAVCAAFGGVFREMSILPRLESSDPRSARYLGLQQSWVPLRKIHKDSRLRFLSPAEMMTPGLWDVQFLNSVMMRSSQPRLFITHPDAYLQDRQAYEAGWTWQIVREMTRVYADVTESQEVPEADALEECWAWSEQLDEVPSAHTSMSMRRQRQRVSTSPLLARSHSAQSLRWSASPAVVRGQSPLLAGRRDSVPPQTRTTSAPVVAPARHSPASDRLRMVSCGRSGRSSPSMRVTSQARLLKRRRTRSPSHRHFTPRWTASPSPMPPGLGDRQVPRGTTPFAYATPYSNAPLQEGRTVRGGSVARGGPDYELPGIDMYGSESDESYADGGDDCDNGESVTSEEAVTHVRANPLRDSQQQRLPEDEPWPGIEDQGRMSDAENINPGGQQDGQSEASSQPSEYPSTNRAWPVDESVAFHIHEDDD